MHEHPPGHRDIKNSPDQHAFVMLGEKTLFLHHLTMFLMENHMYQVVAQATLPGDVMRRYLDERKKNPNVPYFVGNTKTPKEEHFMTIPELQTGARRSFVCDIYKDIPRPDCYKGWPWEGLQPFLPRVPITIDRLVYYRHFDFNLDYPKSLTYVLFGSGDEAHIAHYQVKHPDFDQAVSLAEAPPWLPPTQLEAGVHINIPGLPNRPDVSPLPEDRRVYCSDPLKDQRYDVQYCGYDPTPVMRREIRIGVRHWFSTGVVNLLDDPCSKVPCGDHVGTLGSRLTSVRP